MPILGSLAAAGGVAKAAGVDPVKEVKGLISSVFGSGGRRKNCGTRQRKLAETINKYLSQSDKQSIVRWHKSTFPGSGIRATGSKIAYHYFGGGDCRVTSREGKQFQKRVNRKIEQAAEREKKKQKRQKGGTPAAAATMGGFGNLLTAQNLLIGGVALMVAFFLFQNN